LIEKFAAIPGYSLRLVLGAGAADTADRAAALGNAIDGGVRDAASRRSTLARVAAVESRSGGIAADHAITSGTA
jgi:hypothetical protein